MSATAPFTFWLWLFTLLLLLRVAGQILVAWRAPRWLPPMEQWQSGLLPYPVLLLGQVIVLTLMFWICIDFTRGQGLFVEPYPGRGRYVTGFGLAYAAGMVVRYVIWMWRRPDQRWLGGTIPIVFHSVVAAFIYVFGAYHVRLAG
jgi:uncharacterized protein